MPLILASESKRRIELLRSINVEFSIEPADVDESVLDNEDPVNMTERLSISKSEKIAENNTSSFVLAADTTVYLDTDNKRTILCKPEDNDEARYMLKLLSGKVHSVCTSYCLVNKAQKIREVNSVISEVEFYNLNENLIDKYIENKECFGKAGGYAIQGIGAIFIKRINGSNSNIIGLPLAEVALSLEKYGLWNPGQLVR